jgi:4-aminobutyrate aminotransferase-like enzyme
MTPAEFPKEQNVAAIDRERLSTLLERERGKHARRTAASRAAFEAADHLFGRVPMTWMNKWSGGYPLYLAKAHGNRIVDLDGNEYVDFALGDTGWALACRHRRGGRRAHRRHWRDHDDDAEPGR